MKPSGTVFVALMLSALMLSPIGTLVPLVGPGQAFAEKGGNSGKGEGQGQGGNAENGNGNGGSASSESSASSDVGTPSGNRGALASELKWLNAAHASPQARLKASPNSRVGKIASYRTAVVDVSIAKVGFDSATLELERLASLTPEELLAAYPPAPDAFDEAAFEEALAAAEAAAATDAAAAAELDRLQNLTDEEKLAEFPTPAYDSAAYDAALVAAADELLAAEGILGTAQTAEDLALLAASDGLTLSPEAMAYLHELLDLEPPSSE